MRTRREISRHLQALTQAFYFRDVHRSELSEEGRVQLRAMEDNIALLEWCLESTDTAEVTWGDVRESFKAAGKLFWIRLTRRSPQPDAGTAGPPSERPAEEPE